MQNNSEKKIIVALKYTKSTASSRVRFIQYLEHKDFKYEFSKNSLIDLNLVKNSSSLVKIWILYQSLMKRIVFLFKNRDKNNTLWIQGELFPKLPAWFDMLFFPLYGRIVIDYDDAIFHYYDQHSNFFLSVFNKNKISKLMKYSDAIICGNSYIDEYARKTTTKTILIPTTVDKNRYKHLLSCIDQKKKFSVGWIGTPNTQKYLIYSADILNKIIDSGTEIIAIGASQELKKFIPKISIIPWSENTEVENLKKFSIGIMPLTDGSIQRGKCGFKIIQYLAAGVPFLATPSPANNQIFEDTKAGIISEIDNWPEIIFDLKRNKSLLFDLSINTKNYSEKYSLQSQITQIIKIL